MRSALDELLHPEFNSNIVAGDEKMNVFKHDTIISI
jgi:hypothetical protein